jgi:hypothetical protein
MRNTSDVMGGKSIAVCMQSIAELDGLVVSALQHAIAEVKQRW